MTPVVVPTPGGDCFAMYQPGSGPAVLFCPPFGDEGLRTARVWRDLAVTLGENGLASLRFDLPGTGNSTGAPTDPDRVPAWRAAVRACARWLAERHEGRVVLFGHRFGALLALDAVADGVAAERLVLLDPPASGAVLARHFRAQARINGFCSLPDGPGYIQANGVPLAPDTMAALATLPAPLMDGHVPPTLLVLNETTALRSPWPERLREHGGVVESIPFAGFDDFVPHDAFRAKPPIAVLQHVVDTLVRSAGPVRPSSPPLRPARLAFDGFVEQPLAFGPSRGLFGILCQPDTPTPGLRPVVLPTMGADPCSGMARMWTELARRLARRGIASLRFDMAGVGESEGGRPEDLFAAMYATDRFRDLRYAVDAMTARGFRSVNVVAYCAGAYATWHAAALDGRIGSILAGNLLYLNRQTDLTRQALDTRPGASQIGGAGGRLSRFLPTGGVAAFRKLDDRARRAVPRQLRVLLRAWAGDARQARRHLAAILARGCTVSFVMSDDDHGHIRLRRAYGEVPRLPPGVELTVIAEADHQFTDRRHRTAFLDLAAAFAERGASGRVPSVSTPHPTRILETAL